MVRIPAGAFTMGRDDGPPTEGPAHPHSISHAYWIARRPVTQACYRRFAEATNRPLRRIPWLLRGDDHPAVGVSWHDAQAFCAWAGLSLPSEAEWEKAARAAAGAAGPAVRTAFSALLPGALTPGPMPLAAAALAVGAPPAGRIEEVGEILEWCSDAYEERAYLRHATGDASPAVSGRYRLARGGPWSGPPDVATVTRRTPLPPERTDPELGFRPVVRGERP